MAQTTHELGKMVEIKHRIVHIDAVIDLKDYFRAYVDAVKSRLIAGCLITAAVIGSVAYFFILIGEQEILWKLSPFLFGVPVVAIASPFLRIHASYRKYLARLSESEKTIRYQFPESGDGFDVI